MKTKVSILIYQIVSYRFVVQNLPDRERQMFLTNPKSKVKVRAEDWVFIKNTSSNRQTTQASIKEAK